ncbi:MAG: ABC transporter permease [Verrucomicrobia bacterium]|nr:ABC transporter permease [Verrucomicrobiota bacterium]
MPWYLYLALKQLFPTGRRFPFFTFISVMGVALGVALLVVVTSVMGGFGYEIRRMIVDTEGEIQIKSSGFITDSAEVLKKAKAVPGVVAATPYAAGAVMIEYHGKPAYPGMRGLDLATVEEVVQLSKYVRLGSLDDLDDDSVMLSSQLARSIGASLGSKIEVYSPLMIERFKSDEIFMPREVRVVGIVEIGHQQLDSSTVYCTIRLAQDLYGLGSSVHGINVRVREGQNEDAVAARLNTALPYGIRAFSWMDSFSDFLWVLQLEKNMIFFLLLFIVIVAGFSVASSLLISVVRKTREIGLLGALGGKSRQVAACFCFQGLIIGICGTALGLGLGFVALTFRNDFVLLVTKLTQRDEVLQRFYQFSQLPSHTAVNDIVLIVVSSVFISMLAGLLPAWRAARLKPVEALRSE